MSMLLTLLAMSAVVFALSLVCLKAALGPVESRPELRSGKKLELDSRFFAGDRAPVPLPMIPQEVLVAQIERHVRLEQAVAENFLEVPSRETLHSPSYSQFVN
jgi:hypothetical protein